MIMFAVMISIPFFTYETYFSIPSSYETGTDLVWNRTSLGFGDLEFFVEQYVTFH